jgi:oligoendopeptidase F
MNLPTQQSPWDLQDLLPGGPQDLDTLIAEVEGLTQEIEALRPVLTEGLSVDAFLEVLAAREKLSERLHLAEAYAYLAHAADTRDPQALSLLDRLDQLAAGVSNRLLFFNLWFKELSEEQAAPYIAAAGDLAYYLRSIRRYKPHTLSEAEEKISTLKDVNGSEGLVKVYEILTNGFTFQMEVDGEQKTLTRDGLNKFYRHPSPEMRQAAFQELYRVYKENKTVLAQIYFYLVRDLCVDQELRGYSSPISIRNLSNDIPDAVVDALLEVCRANTHLYQRYFRLKARLLGVERLRRSDVYAPLAQAEKQISFSGAVQLVMDSFEKFSPVISQAAARVFEQNHLDSEVRPKKRSGAFCMSITPKHTPYVLVNFTGRLDDAATLAHELGHAVHSMLACGRSVLNFHAPLPLAETASVFAEMLITDRLLKEETDPEVRRDLLVSILDDAYATVQRQAFVSIFEKEACRRIQDGCTSEELAAHYLESLHEQFGDAVEISEDFAWEWLTIPHIYASPFYPYAYSFGQLLVLSLYQQYLSQGEAFIPGYLKLLAYGGSAEPQTVLAEAGLDITSPDFWQGGYNVLENFLQQLEELVGGNS